MLALTLRTMKLSRARSVTFSSLLLLLFAGGVFHGCLAATRVVPNQLIENLNKQQPQHVLVLLDDTAIIAEAAKRRSGNAPIDDEATLTFKAQRYAQIKQSTLSKFAPADLTPTVDYSHLPMALLQVRNRGALTALMTQPEVIGVYEDRPLYHTLAQSLPLIGQPTVGAAGYTGAGSTVVVLDTGVNYTLSQFGTCSAPNTPSGCKVIVASDLAPNDSQLDDIGHGTNVSAIVLGAAPGAKLAVFDVFNGTTAPSSTVITGINWAIANKAAYNIVAVNMSLGDNVKNTSPCGSTLTNPFVTPIANAYSAGILSVIASGNNTFTDGITNPACTPNAVSVGAVYDANIGGINWTGLCTDAATTTDKVACFSNSASFLSLLAPGAMITAGGTTQGGTSQATPHVSGAIAVLKAKFATDMPSQTVSRMTNNGVLVLDSRNGISTPRLSLLTAARPDNDSFNASDTISGANSQITATSLLASKESGEPNHAGNVGGASLWWTWTATESAILTFSTAGSSFDTVLAIYTGSAVNNLVQVASNDNDGGAGGVSSVSFAVTAGTSYRIAVDGANGAAGNVTLAWTSQPAIIHNDADVPLLPPAAFVVLSFVLGIIAWRRRRAALSS